MRVKAYSAKRKIAAAATLLAVLAAVPVLAKPAPDQVVLDFWQTPMASFKKAGEWIGHENYDRARSELNDDSTNFPAPYNGMASAYLGKLDSALEISDPKDPKRLGQLMDLCTQLRACDAALELQSKEKEKKKKKVPDSSDSESAWRLWETGNPDAALADYKRKLEAEPVDTWQNYWSEQIHLIQLSSTNRNKIAYTAELVHQHYLKGFELPPDCFSALEELSRATPFAHDAREKIVLDQLRIKTFDLVGDEAARTAWENKLLNDFMTNGDACAGVYLDRAMRAYNKQDMATATSLFREVSSDYPDTQAYGDAQYTLALILQQQQNYDEAIMEYAKLFHSKVDDYARPQENTEDYKCYRFRAALGISGCYEEKGDYVHALEYVELARDHYKYLSWCKACMDEMKQTIRSRVNQLEEKIKTAGPVANAP